MLRRRRSTPSLIRATVAVLVFVSLRCHRIAAAGCSRFTEAKWRRLHRRMMTIEDDTTATITTMRSDHNNHRGVIPETSGAVRYFINLTNGIEAFPLLMDIGVPADKISFLRLQSTHCEAKNYQAIIEHLDYNLLMHLAMGYICLVFDFGCRGSNDKLIGKDDPRQGIPRAYWWGLEWISHVIEHFWFSPSEEDDGDKDFIPTNEPDHVQEDKEDRFPESIRMVRGYNMKKTFDDQIRALPKDVKRRIKYFRPFVNRSQKNVHLYPIYSKTDYDGKREYYASLLHQSATSATPFLSDLRSMSKKSIDEFVLSQLVPERMHLYRSSDFVGIGRSRPRKKQEDALGDENDNESQRD